MKRFMALTILLFMVVSLVIPISNINDKNQYENDVVEPVLLADITYELVIEEVVKEPDPYEIAIQEMQEEMKEIESIEDNKEWFLAYKDIAFKYAKWIDPPETIYDYFTEDEVRLICRVVETETYQCDLDSKVNVANVVLNRIESGEFGETVEDVITADNQFAYGRKSITEDTILAVMYAYEIIDTTNGALYFHSNDTTDTFCGKTYIFTDSVGHNFY